MHRSRAIILKDDCIALIRRVRDERTYYVFPGGGAEAGETPEQTARRESREELGLKVEIDRLVAEVTFRGQTQYYFLAHATGGKFGTGQGPEMLGKYPIERGTYTPIWMPLSQLSKIRLVPPAMADMVCRAKEDGWPGEIVHIQENG
jgi:8-oxo-dGTP pyrophosphatase MutT (NUDIX family)